jgi:hypothetical protein
MTDTEIIDALGGTKAVAELCNVTKGAVSQWRKDGIPDSRRMYLKLLRPDAFVPPEQKPKHSAPLKRTSSRKTVSAIR